jgi:hypothetical protein
MSLLAPWAIWAGVLGAAAVVLLHLVVQRRRVAPLPTARFLPDTASAARSRVVQRRPADPLLLALRGLALLLLGAAFASPARTAMRTPLARVVALDISRAVADPTGARDQARTWLRDGDALVVFDTVARAVPAGALDSVRFSDGPASLSAALLAASRVAAELAGRADTVDVVLVSPLVEEAWDAATERVRAAVPGVVRLVRVPAAPHAATTAAAVDAALDDGDPLRAAIDPDRTAPPGSAAVRLRRSPVDDADLAWAGEARGRVLVEWSAAAVTPTADTIGAVAAGAEVVVAPFARQAEPPPGRVVARWADGRPAATERAEGAGCVRAVRVPLDPVGDLVLRESTRRFVAAMLAPCGAAADLEPLDDVRVATLAGRNADAVPARAGVVPLASPRISLTLIGAALLLLLAELPLRRARRAG